MAARDNLLMENQIRDAESPEKGQSFIWDADPRYGGVAGFGLRVTAGGAKTFILNYRFADPKDLGRKSTQYRYAIGPAKQARGGAGWTVAEARKEADRWRKLIDRGESHPLAERKGRRDAVKAAREAATFEEAIRDYIQHEQKGRKSNAAADEVQRALLKACHEWLALPVADVTPIEIGKLLRSIRDGDAKKNIKPRPYLANRVFSYLRTFFRWCATPDVALVKASPMIGMNRPWDGEEVRDRWFNDKEIKAIWKAADTIGGIKGAYLKALLLTGKRKTALAAMKWSEIGDDWTWTPPADPRRRKRNKRQHAIPLPQLLQRILKPLKPTKGDTSPYVFPGRNKGSHLDPGTYFQDKIKEASQVGDFFFHASKHTLETRLSELGVPPHVKDLVLDHAPVRGSGAGYDHWHYKDEMADALERWAAHVEKVVAPEGAAVLR